MASKRQRLWFVSIEPIADARLVIADVQKRITRLQRNLEIPQYSVVVFESGHGLHGHIVFTGPREIAERLKASESFGCLIVAKPVTDYHRLANGYLSKERTPQAGWRRNHILGGRIRGSHQLPGGGDRVRPSRELERDALETGYIEAYLHTNARRSEDRKPYRLRRLYPKTAPRPIGQLSLMPELDKPVSRLRNYGGGIIPKAVALEIEFLRGRLGLSQAKIANAAGFSQPQYSNALQGRFGLSRQVALRLRLLLLDTPPPSTSLSV